MSYIRRECYSYCVVLLGLRVPEGSIFAYSSFFYYLFILYSPLFFLTLPTGENGSLSNSGTEPLLSLADNGDFGVCFDYSSFKAFIKALSWSYASIF